jgi:hypothetical protein
MAGGRLTDALAMAVQAIRPRVGRVMLVMTPMRCQSEER